MFRERIWHKNELIGNELFTCAIVHVATLFVGRAKKVRRSLTLDHDRHKLTAKNASGTVAQIYAEVRKRRAATLLVIETCIHR
jgi:hypothetical protein